MIADIIHGENFDIGIDDILEIHQKCNRTIEQQLTKIHEYEPFPNIQGDSQFREAVNRYLAQGKIVKRYKCMIVDRVEEGARDVLIL